MNSKSTNLLPLFGAHLIQALNTTLQSEEERRGLFHRKKSNWIHKMKKRHGSFKAQEYVQAFVWLFFFCMRAFISSEVELYLSLRI